MQQLDQLHSVEHICTQTAVQAAQNADALLIMVPWEEFQAHSLYDVANFMRKKMIFDLCRLYKDERFEMQGIQYWRLGGR